VLQVITNDVMFWNPCTLPCISRSINPFFVKICMQESCPCGVSNPDRGFKRSPLFSPLLRIGGPWRPLTQRFLTIASFGLLRHYSH
jgi:hypothetical protein